MELVTVTSYRDAYEAHLARGILEAAGIEAFVADEHLVGVDWLYSQALGGVKLRVAAESAAEARELLAWAVLGDSDGGEINAAPGEPCPMCGAAAGSRDSLDTRFRAASLWLGFPLSLGGYRWSCAECGHRWRSVPLYRGPVAVLVELVALIGLLAGWLIRLPYGIAVGLSAYARNREFYCWSCGSPYSRHHHICPECAIILPDSKAYDELIEPGRHYDGACSNCYTPYALEDYGADRASRACSHCGAELSG